MINLIGILVVAVGFALRFNTLLVVMAAGVVTGLVAGMSFNEIIEAFGKYFVENRYMTLPVVLMVPLIGLLERHGLQERAVALIRQMKAVTAGRVILLYTGVRQITVALGINIGSSGGAHASFVRPLVAPMAEAAARQQVSALQAKAAAKQQSARTAPRAGAAAGRQTSGEAEGGARMILSEETIGLIRANAAAAENTGNFFGEDVFIAVGAILLMKGFFDNLKIEVSVWGMALWGIPSAVLAFGVMCWRARVLDRSIDRAGAAAASNPHGKGAK